MDKGFWAKIKKPIFALAPLANVTDAAFRRVIACYSKPAGPHVMYTEFVSADGLFLSDEKGRNVLMRDLIFTDAERPIVAQFFTSRPDMMERASALARELGFDGVDINMGCPDRSVEKQGGGAALIKNPERAAELIRAAWNGVGGTIPVSVKTRIGYNKEELSEWLPVLLDENPVALTLHLRTRKEMSKVPANWEYMKKAIHIRDELGSDTLLLGNGDADSLEEARKRSEESGADGVMIGRGIFGNPWFFSGHAPTPKESLQVLGKHIEIFDELLGDIKSFAIMKKHFKAYVTGWDGARELRLQLMEVKNAKEAQSLIRSYLRQ
jgi:nifR3 family TIM-barrel protein